MQNETLESLRSGYEVLSRTGEWPEDGLLASGFELHRDPFVDAAGVPPGPGAPGELMRVLNGAMRDVSLETERFIEAPDGVVVAVIRMRANGRASGIALDKQQAHVWTFENDVAVRMQIYGQTAEALRAVGLSA
ncbi:MAG TPA: hypothetical protein VKG82_06770 [Solirubrobacteraceae bacterium]|nr:hypothetical protein [Solirubrobacteraceae bacterium]